jgi:hypothetical protein
MKLAAGLLIANFCLLTAQPAVQVDEEAAKKVAATMTRLAVLEYFKDREFKLESEELKATAKAIDPEKNVEVEVLEITVLPNHVSIKFQIDARLGFEGTLETKEEKTDIRGEADVGQEVSVEADYYFLEGQLKVQAKITEIEFAVKIRDVTPGNIPGGKERIEKLAQEELDRQRDDLLQEMNDWLDQYLKTLEYTP